MDVSVESTSNLGRRLTVRVPDATVQTHIQERMQSLAKDAKLKGFRPGKVPQKVLQQKFGESVRLEAIEQVMRQALTDAISDKSLKPAGMPRIDNVKDQSGEDLHFTAEFEIYPEFELVDMSKEQIDVKKVEITADDVAKQIQKLQLEMAGWETKEKKIEQLDQIKIDFSLQVDDADSTKDAKQDVTIQVKEDALLPGLMQELVGKQKGDELKLDLTYPDTWPDENVRNKGVHVEITIKEVFARDPIAEAEVNKRLKLEEGREALEAHVKARMQDQVDKMVKEQTQEKVLESLSEKNQFDLPDALIQQEMESMKRDEMRQAESQQRPANIPGDDEIKDVAKRRVELGLLLNKVIEKFELKADGENVRKQVDILASQFPDPAKVVEIYYSNDELLGSIEKKVLLDKAVDAILETMQQNETKVSFEDMVKE